MFLHVPAGVSQGAALPDEGFSGDLMGTPSRLTCMSDQTVRPFSAFPLISIESSIDELKPGFLLDTF